jgi:hypothetical protein
MVNIQSARTFLNALRHDFGDLAHGDDLFESFGLGS